VANREGQRMSEQADMFEPRAPYNGKPGFKTPGPSQEAAEKGTGSLRSAPISHGIGGFAQ